MLAIVKRVGIALITLFIVMTLTFFLIHKVPGDPLYMWAVELAQEYGIKDVPVEIEKENEYCIVCGLCVRACNEIVGACL